jgi:N-acetyl sugar amidotransferase
MDTTVPEIVFDHNGECQFCKMHDRMDELYPRDPAFRARELEKIVDKIRKSGKGKPYDCVCGVSGGRDSTYVLHVANSLGLRPLAVHFDNGWNSTIAVSNIYHATNKLKIDLETEVADWDEFRDLQVSFLKASVPDVEIPTDVAIHTVLHRIAAQEGIKYVLNGHSFRTEGIAPIGWTYMDGKYIEAIQNIYGRKSLRNFKNFKIFSLLYYSFYKNIKVIPILNYFDYDHQLIGELLEKELKWKYYGGHHHESTYTYFIQSYLLPRKFKIDKRKTELSAAVREGKIDRSTALDEVHNTPYPTDEKLLKYVLNKLDISMNEWSEIYNTPPKSFKDYPSYYSVMRALKQPIKIACDSGMLPELLYLKYLGN